MRQSSSPGNGLEVRGGPTSPQSVSDSLDVPMPEGVAQRLSCLVYAHAQFPGAREARLLEKNHKQ
jgi:hypothetical protein